MSLRILLVEDDASMQATLARALRHRAMDVVVCGDGAQVLALWQQHQPAVVLLDLTLPNQDGLDVLQAARSAGLRTPVLILTARGTVGDKVLGLQLGADDYLPKPFDLDELQARIMALARRVPQVEGGTGAALQGLWLDKNTGLVYHDQQVMDLPPREHVLLRLLLDKPGVAVTRERAMQTVFPVDKEVSEEALDVVAYRLRKRLAELPWQLVTLRGLGYVLQRLEKPNPMPLGG